MFRSHLARFAIAATFCSALAPALLTTAHAQAPAVTYTAIYNFGTNANDPLQPRGPDAIAQGRDGNLWTTSANGGTANNGTVFKVTPSGTVTVVSNLGDPGDSPFGGVTLGTDGNYYGTTEVNGEGPGVAFKVTPTGVETGLHTFENTGDGACPYAAPIQGTDGNFYGTTTTVCGFGSQGTVYKLTSAGVLTTLHTFTGADGNDITSGLVQGTDGNFYGTSYDGGTNNDGVVFKLTPTGTVTVLHNFAGTDGSGASRGLIQATDGNFYGITNSGGTSNAGVIFKITSSGTYTILHNLNGTTDGNGSACALVQATDGKLYGAGQTGGSSNLGTIFSITTTGTFTVLVNFSGANGSTPNSPLKQNTNGVLYGDTYQGGDLSLCSGTGCGVFYSLNIGAKAFLRLQTTSGKVGSKISMFGQGFSSSSVVKFNGVAAAKPTLSGTTYLTATVQAGASDGFVTVTTGTSTLTSTVKFTVHDSWGAGAVMPTPTVQSAAAVLSGSIYVVGGANASGTVIDNLQIYNPTSNTWSTGTPLPVVIQHSSAAVVNSVLYVFGGDDGVDAPTNAVWAYSTKTKAWTSMSPMLTARNGTLAVVEKNIVYVMGGNLGNGANFVATVESYNPATNTWKGETSMDGAKDYPAGGLIGTTIVVADGATASGQITGDTEGYNATTNAWTEFTADPTARTGSCSGVVGTTLYDVGGYINNDGPATAVNESYSQSTNKWTTTLLSIPQGTMYASSAVDNGQLYCIGGWATLSGSPISNVQIYQP